MRGENAGRPLIGPERMLRTPVTMPATLREYARQIGGTVSAGVRLALQAHMDGAEAQQQEQARSENERLAAAQADVMDEHWHL